MPGCRGKAATLRRAAGRWKNRPADHSCCRGDCYLPLDAPFFAARLAAGFFSARLAAVCFAAAFFTLLRGAAFLAAAFRGAACLPPAFLGVPAAFFAPPPAARFDA